ncbi:MAG: PEP-CTERM sorting domain-containing protein [Planctomycetia bacterium]|nr:PEP-CTERM sorting domain-containing protein [Planctomycetia bacterium]
MKTHKIFSLATLFLAVAGGARAEILTENKTVTVAGDTEYSSQTDGVKLTFNVGSGTHSGAITGKLGVVVDITGQNKNGNRVTFSGTNTFTGGLTVKNGTLLGATGANLGATNSTITLENATLMIGNASNPTVSQNILINSQFGALRPSNSFTMAGKISGNGDFLVHCDTNKTLTLSNTNNDYTGITNIGGYNVIDSANSNAGMKLGANEVLPNGTVVQLGVHYGTVNGNTKLAEAWLDMNGKKETISGLMGIGRLQDSATAAATLNIVTDKNSVFYATRAGTDGYNFTGSIGTADKGLLTVNVSGDGTQILGGSFTNAAVTVSDTATLSFGTNTDVKTLKGLSVADGASLKMANGTTVTASGSVSINGNIIVDGTSTIALTETGSIYLGQAYNNLTVNVNKGTYRENGIENSANIVMTEESTYDMNGFSKTIETLTGNYTNSSTATASTLTFGGATDSIYNGTISKPSGSKGIALVKQGANTVTFGGTVTVNSLNISEGKIKLSSTANLTVEALTGTGELDLNGGELSTSSAPVVTLTNSNNDHLSVFTYTGNGANATMPKITGNTRFVLNMGTNTNNANRTFLTAGSEIKGGIEIKRGTLRVDDLNYFKELPTLTTDGKTRTRIDFNGGSLMTTQSFSDDYTFYMMEGGGAFRKTGSDAAELNAYITGVGSFEVVNDTDVYINNQKNDYQGWTYIGKTGFRSDGLKYGTNVFLGNNEVLPDTTVLQIGAGDVLEMNVLDLNGKTETVAGLTGGKTSLNYIKNTISKINTDTAKEYSADKVNGRVTSTNGGTLIVNDSEDLTYSGEITGNANVKKTGSATWTVDGNVDTTGTMSVTNGTLNMSGNVNLAKAEVSGGKLNMTGTGNLTNVNISGGNYIHAFQGTLQNMNLTGGTVKLAGGSLADTAINATSGDSTIILSANTYYLQEKFESPDVGPVDSYYRYSGNLTENANQITNMDQWVNVWSAYYNQKDESVWGTKDVGDKSVTNVFEMKLVNTNAEDVTVDFGKCFHNDAQVVLMDGDTVVATIDWTNKTDGKYASNSTGSINDVTLEAGKEYTLIVRASRYNRTIGAHSNGLNNDAGNLVGIGVRESGTELWFGMNIGDSGEWGWSGSGIYSTMVKDTVSTFAPKSLDIADGATVTLKMLPTSQNKLTTAATGPGTLKLANIGGALGNAFMTLTAGVDGNVLVDSNVTLATENVTVGGTVTLAENAVLALNGETGTLTLNTLEGLGRIEVDLDSIANNENALIVFTETDLENIDLTGLTLELVSDRPEEERMDEVYHLFAGVDLSKVEAMKYDSAWSIGLDANGIYFTLGNLPDSSVPEPATWGMLLIGLGGMLLVVRKRERK